MKKRDLKKLALLGIASGLIVSQGEVQANQDSSNLDNFAGLMAAGCGSGCSHKDGKRNYNGCSAQGGTSSYNGCGATKGSNGCGATKNYNGCGGTKNYNGCGSMAGSRRDIAEADEFAKDGGSNDSNTGTLMSEDQLMSQLNEHGKQMYRGLNAEGKALAIKLASRSCKGTNDCKGQNACKTANNSCAGKGSCAGTSKCSFKDKNLAVKVAAQKQAEKRAQVNSGSY